MRTFHWVSGELTEVQRFINVPMRWCEQYPARERRELWIRTDAGPELKFVVHTRYLPARRGHRVAVLVGTDEAAALLNVTTGEGVNFVRADPPLLWRRCDAVWIALSLAVVLAASFWLDQPRALLSIMGLPIAVLLLLLGRLVRRWFLRRTVAAALKAADSPRQLRSQWRRVK
jgi:hypothetical protein